MLSACKTKHAFLLAIPFVIFIQGGCRKHPYKLPYNNIGGYVIGKESCNSDADKDYWILDFTVYQDSPHIGDTLVLNGITYTNVLKVKGLQGRLKQTGMLVSVDYNIISPEKVITSGCTANHPVTYPLKELFIINQFEIR